MSSNSSIPSDNVSASVNAAIQSGIGQNRRALREGFLPSCRESIAELCGILQQARESSTLSGAVSDRSQRLLDLLNNIQVDQPLTKATVEAMDTAILSLVKTYLASGIHKPGEDASEWRGLVGVTEIILELDKWSRYKAFEGLHGAKTQLSHSILGDPTYHSEQDRSKWLTRIISRVPDDLALQAVNVISLSDMMTLVQGLLGKMRDGLEESKKHYAYYQEQTAKLKARKEPRRSQRASGQYDRSSNSEEDDSMASDDESACKFEIPDEILQTYADTLSLLHSVP